MHNNSQGSTSQFDIEGLNNLNKNNNPFGGDLDTINEENVISPIKMNYDLSKKRLENQNNSQKSTSNYSFAGIGNVASVNIPNKPSINLNIVSTSLGGKENNINASNNTRNNMNMNLLSNNEENVKMTDISKNNVNNIGALNSNNNIKNKSSNINGTALQQNEQNLQINVDSYKFQLSQQIDAVEKIATQSVSGEAGHNLNSNINKIGNEPLSTNNQNLPQQPSLNIFNSNSISEQEISDHQRFNAYCSEVIDNALNKNIEYIDSVKNNFVNQLEEYKLKFKGNAQTMKKLILLYSDDVFQKEKNKMAISNLVQQLLNHINSFFLEMNKFSGNLNMGINDYNRTNNGQ